MHEANVRAVSRSRRVLQSTTLAALGIVFGDIGTSPLYAIREAFHGPHAIALTPDNILGVLSLIIWSLILVISVKYFHIVMKADNNGEGGVLALAELAFPSRGKQRGKSESLIFLLGLFGASLLVGDGIITPAISVLSAVEGLEIAAPVLHSYIIPLTIVVLAVLFCNQHYGTAKIGATFGLVLLLWFIVLGMLGIYGICSYPKVVSALSPHYAFDFFARNGTGGLVVLGAVFLVVTGGEALYADMGHFGRQPICRGWFLVAFPALVLNYFGQGALLLRSPEAVANPFYNLSPEWALYPLIAIATMATVIASQAAISGVFSLTRQAVQLGYAPRFKIIHTSEHEIGQIYIPKINWWLFVSVCWLVITFRSSSAMASAYGVAVSGTMIITSLFAAIVARRLWKWGLLKICCIFIPMLALDAIFLGANFSKVFEGGWLPLSVGIVVVVLMTTWYRGRQLMMERLRGKIIPFQEFLASLSKLKLTRIEKTAVFMTGSAEGTPMALSLNVRHNEVLHSRNVLLTVVTEEIPFVAPESRVRISIPGDSFHRVIAYYGFAESPSIKEILEACADAGLFLKQDEITYFLGHETLFCSKQAGMSGWRRKLFAFMSSNAELATAYYGIPSQQVVEMGVQLEL